ncbi:DUF3298 domain-containing protein [Mucilaginibacter ximonensis]|uniref:DUF3298 domain-containing protein n=1 Tax=Mucilaginibacter ximonensis TaxID=538021 RepID=A0ABW5YAP0_9SPHI
MKTWHLLTIGLFATLSSCNWGEKNTTKPDINTDTLAYIYKTVKQRAADCGNKPDTGCTVAQVKYPLFKNQPVLNDTVNKRIIGLFGYNNPDRKPDTNLAKYIMSFVKQYESDKAKQFTRNMFYTLDLTVKIVRQDSSLTTIELSGYNYEGGAHGGSITTFINWNTKANKDIKLGDIFTDGYKQQLTTIADTIFRKQEKLTPTQSLANDYFFKDNKFALNENFLITPLGIKFLYNQYEIKPYAAGQTDLFIPYAKIKSLLKPNTVITQYLK